VASATPTDGTAPLTVDFTSDGSSDSDGTITDYEWDFGDGVTSTAANPSHTYNSPGSYGAVLTVWDNDGLSDTDGLTITVNTPPNQPPTAVAGATPTSGTAPLAVKFSSAGSFDPDGTITAYLWNFGNGVTKTNANPSYTYKTGGSYTAQLIVTDNQGATGTNTVGIAVQPADIYVADIALSLKTGAAGNTTATAKVTIKNASGAVVAGASVTGNWSGLTSGTSTATTGNKGVATLTSTRTKKHGTFTFTVTSVSASGYIYNPARNVETSDSITY
jgi:PKD repeat protein